MAAGSPIERPGEPIRFESAPGGPLEYLARGEGSPVVLVHGSLTDARYWLRSRQLSLLAGAHRVVAPSRRYNHPNPWQEDTGDYSAWDDAEDLIAFISASRLDPVHLVGHSYGAYGALLVSLQRPDLVRSLVLAEPPIMRWLPELPRGRGVWERFEAAVWAPLGVAFREGGDDAGLDATALWYFGTRFTDIDPAWQRDFEDSVREWRALTTSRDAFPYVPFDWLAEVRIPTLVLSAGQNAGGFNDVIDEALTGMIPGARRVVVPDVSHEMFLDSPELVASHLAALFDEAS